MIKASLFSAVLSFSVSLSRASARAKMARSGAESGPRHANRRAKLNSGTEYMRIHGPSDVERRSARALAHRRRGSLKVYSLRWTTRLSSTLANARQSVLLVPRTAIMKPLTLLYRAINLNITTRVSRSFGFSDLSPGEDRDVT